MDDIYINAIFLFLNKVFILFHVLNGIYFLLHSALDYGSQNSDVRIRARNLHSQAITQLRKLQKLGNDVQKHVQLQDKQNAYNATKTDSTLLDLSNG